MNSHFRGITFSIIVAGLLVIGGLVGTAGSTRTNPPSPWDQVIAKGWESVVPKVSAQSYHQLTLQPGSIVKLGSYSFVQLDSIGTLMALESVFLCPLGSYVDNGSCQLCSVGLSNCSACASPTKCHTCTTGYHLENFICIPDCDEVTNCNSCDSPNHCSPTGCTTGYYASSTTGQCDTCSSLDSNCLTCSNSSTCNSCTTGYYPTGSSCNSCTDTLSHCTSCSNSSTCLTCESGYHLDPATSTCIPDCSVTNCNTCSSPNFCSDTPGSCSAGYYSDSGGCLDCATAITGCSECSDSSTCTTCRPGYTLEANGTCTPTGSVPDCSSYSDPDICSSCNLGYYLDSNSCTSCNTSISNCASCNYASASATLTCDGCDLGYHLDSGSCVMDCNPTGGNCNSCTTPNYCAPTGCATGYYQTGGVCASCTTTLSHCTSCSDGTTCLACETGYHVDPATNTCVLDCNPAGGNCNTCDSPDHCSPTGCAPGYTTNPTTGTCTMNCSVANCASTSSCYGPDQCGTCSTGYYPNLTNGQCNACTGLHPDCLTCTDSATCTSCGGASYLNGTTCESCAAALPGCTACSDSSTCTSCETGYNLVGNTCVPTGTDPNCNVYTAPGVCSPLGCGGGYYNDGGNCSACTTGCSDCSSGSTCNSCSSGYYLTGSGPGSSCTPCSTVSTGCTACSDSSTCTTCATGYNLVGGTCVPTGSVENCTAYSDPDQCSTCSTGYYLNGNNCPACSDTLTTNCLSCSSAGNCTSCAANTILQSGECFSCSDAVTNCSSCDGTSCTGCSTGSYLEAGICNSCATALDGCNECSDSDTCTSCDEGYNLVGNTCIPTGSVSHCTTYSDPDECSACATGYTLDDDNNTCIMNCTTANCNTCSAPNYCAPTGCDAGYFNNAGVCAACNTTIPGCTTCSSGATCTACDTTAGYVLDGTTCRSIPAAPTPLTIPTTIYNAQTITISWDPSTNATGYILERSCNGDDWSQAYSGSATSTTNDLSGCDGPVAYRVKAYNTLVTIESDYTTSTPQNYAACSGNCTTCSDSSTCTTCTTGYTLDAGACVMNCNPTGGNCTICDSPDHCSPTGCDTGYYSTGGICESCGMAMTGCAQCSNSSTCSVCAGGYDLVSGECIPTGDIANCTTYSDPDVCSACNTGTYLDLIANACPNCNTALPNCLTCNNATACTSCSTGTILTGGSCASCSTAVTNCSSCDGTACTGCSSGYYLNSGACSLCSATITGCTSCSDGNTCTACADGYNLVGDTCIPTGTVDNCTTYSTPGQCSACATGYTLNGNTCDMNCNPTGGNCLTCDTPDHCSPTGCASGYFSDNGVCSECSSALSGCTTCSSGTTCVSCDTDAGYVLGSGACHLIPQAPINLTIPTTIYNAQTIAISWDPATNATGYILERSCNSSEWSEVYQGATPSASNNLADCDEPVQYRVKAFNTVATIDSSYTVLAPKTYASCSGNCSQCASAAACVCTNNTTPVYTGLTMQEFTPAQCAAVTTPEATCYSAVGTFTDSRDGKQYEIRKFADGNCWMVDNLAYGGDTTNGGTDVCATDTTFHGNINSYSSAWGYGDCINNPADPAYGYLYNWQAAVQHASAYYNNNYTGSTINIQGICPTGWHLPSGGDASSEFSLLDLANGGTGAYRTDCATAACNFFRPGYSFKGVYAGHSVFSGTRFDQGSDGYWWSSTQHDDLASYSMLANSNSLNSFYNYGKSFGLSIRCLKNTVDCSANCTSCNTATTCNQCADGYILTNDTCVPTGTAANCSTYSAPNVCSTCESGYDLVNNQCLIDCTNLANIVGTMQTFTVSNCDAYATPSATGYTEIGCLTDARDGKAYEVRKFADGNCWMVDNLAYGGDAALGGTDECASKTTFDGDIDLSGSAWGYGDCVSNPGSVTYGYLYNWQAAVQTASLYFGNDYQPPQPTQGICPAGWHLPSGGDVGEFYALDRDNGANNAYRADCVTASCNFFRPGYAFKGVYAGQSNDSGVLGEQGIYSRWWSSSRLIDGYSSGIMTVNSNLINSSNISFKDYGHSVRCLKNTVECSTNCISCNTATTCNQCIDGYAVSDGVCVPTGTVANCATYSEPEVCSKCESGWGLVGNTCHSAAPGGADGMQMQDFTSDYCTAFTTPAAAGYTLVGTLHDARDGKTYEVRKFADGNCWMADNLAYGGDAALGGTDECVSKTTFDGCGDGGECYDDDLGASKSGSAWGYGDCRNNPGNPAYGYLYNWQAAIQSAFAYYGDDYQPPEPTQGICPTGWHLPTGDDGGEFATLDIANGGDNDWYGDCHSGSCNFFKPGYAFKSVYAGGADYDGEINGHDYANWWSSTEDDEYDSYELYVDDDELYVDYYDKEEGQSVRCVKNTAECSTNCVSCNSANTCDACVDGYAVSEGVCVLAGTITNCATYSEPEVCSTCHDGYELVDGVCENMCANPTNIIGTMQTFTATDCATYATASANSYTPIGCLTDERDGKAYEVRKFADGQCWMADNLAYGGDASSSGDVCATKTTFDGTGCGEDMECYGASKSGSAWGYGDCRSNPNHPTYGYFYNWQAAVQADSAYYGNDYQPSEPTQGICPTGWHLPTGDDGGEFATLDIANGGDNDWYGDCFTDVCNFFRSDGGFKGLYTGYDEGDGEINDDGYTYWWTSTQDDSGDSYEFFVSYDDVGFDSYGKYYGDSIRCIKNSCVSGFALSGGVCVPTGTIANCATYSAPEVCSTCHDGYELVDGVCENMCANPANIIGTMQDFTVADCGSYATPSATNYTPIGCLTDERDGKAYEVRKFADGQCWMADNLAYGGDASSSGDVCATKTTFDGCGDGGECYDDDLGASKSGSAWGYGDCRDNPGNPDNGYLYNYQAAVQDASAYYGNYYQPPEPTQGICPTGWHLPTGDYRGEFSALDIANGGYGDWYDDCRSDSCNFFQPGGSFKSVYAGYIYDEEMNFGEYTMWWSSTQDYNSSGYGLAVYTGDLYLNEYFNKNEGLSVRCVMNPCPTGYTFSSGACVPMGTITNCATYSEPEVCSACHDGYELVDGVCENMCANPANIIGTMQTFTATDCATYATPSATNYTAIGCLTDERDGKAYEVRKFADGQCWMADNLAYGGDAATGGTDVCATKTTFAGDANLSGSAWGYGDCRNNPGNPDNGYLYNWQAAVQDISAYYNVYYQPPEPTQGICPTGWHLPTGDYRGEFSVLDIANGGNGEDDEDCHSDSCNFFQPGGSFKSVYAGDADYDGEIDGHDYAQLWTSTQDDDYSSYDLDIGPDGNSFDDSDAKELGKSIRCINNSCSSVMSHCTTCSDLTTCTVCANGYVLNGGACIPPVGTCEDGYSLIDGKCELDFCSFPTNIIGTMQTFTATDCATYATASANSYTPIGCLTDERDGKAYEVRKFADGQCWMADNLAYGGDASSSGDVCATKTTFDGTGCGEDMECYGASKSGNAWGYGDCRNNPGNLAYGYLYNYQAAVQDVSAYYDNYYQPNEPTQGICPTGWHLPTGDGDGDFVALDIANGGDSNEYDNCYSDFCNFFQPGGSFKSVYAGDADYDGEIDGHYYTEWWSSTEDDYEWSYDLYVDDDGDLYLDDYGDKSEGKSVRCVMNPCATGFALSGGVCVPMGTITNCATYSEPEVCSACHDGYELVDGVCENMCANPANIIGTMQDFFLADCDNYATPSANSYTPVGCLTDTRDGKAYEVRKFADGQCWMADNLAYGGDVLLGGTDECANKTTFDGCGDGEDCYGASKSGSAWGYGDCRDNPGNPDNGYLYNWQAAVQDASAYHDNDYQPPEPTQGICPVGWHLPSGDDDGEFVALDIANGGYYGDWYDGCRSASCNFFKPGYAFKSVYAGDADYDGEIDGYDYAEWWSSTEDDYEWSYELYIDDDGDLYLDDSDDKSEGQSVRCINDSCFSAMPHCVTCSDLTTCTACANGYVLNEDICIPTGSVANCATYSEPEVCSACEDDYNLISGECELDYCANPANIIGTMQAFTAASCDSYATPSATNYTAIGCLTDERDGKAYEVRKFADGKCWMADNLAYGGDEASGSADVCATEASFNGYENFSGNAWGYGECRNNPGDPNYGYLYNWQAAIQSPSAYYNVSYNPPKPTQGICPTGWHLPSGGTGSELMALDLANGGTGATRTSCYTASCNFFRPGYAFKGVYAGQTTNGNETRINQGIQGNWWTSTQFTTSSGYHLYVTSSYLFSATSVGLAKYNGNSVRCLKNTADCALANCAACSSGASCDVCATGYVLSNGMCVPTGADSHCTAYSAPGVCSTCVSGYELANGECVNICTNPANIIGTMQDFSADDCDAYTTPSALDYTYIGCLTDTRDGKAYEVRKFADGKCWMVDNLAYGGDATSGGDACATKTTFDGRASLGGMWGYGECRNNPSDSNYGYLYNWQAAIQSPSAYYNYSYSPPKPTQGICPTGWHLPSGNTSGEFAALDLANNGTGAYRTSCTDESCNFFRPGNNFNGVYAGYTNSDGTLYNRGSLAYWWSSTQYDSGSGYRLYVNSSYLYPGTGSIAKYTGYSVRCLKNTTDCTLTNCASCSTGASCDVCATGYVLNNGACVPTGTVTGCATYSEPNVCSVCASGFNLVDGECINICTNSANIAGTLQGFTVADCDAYTTPSALDYTYIGCLTDTRDGKAYEVRKFADGKCWMVDNLAYGGDATASGDLCATKTTFDGDANLSGNAWGYGDCRNNPSNFNYGYLYNWQAAVQFPLAHYGNSYQPFQPTQGICPAGWHIPSGTANGDFGVLDKANGGTGTGRINCATDSCNFFRQGYNFKGVYTGFYSSVNSTFSDRGIGAGWWFSTEQNSGSSYLLYVGLNTLTITNSKLVGHGVRCIKNTIDCSTNCATCTTTGTCDLCADGYTLYQGTCIPNNVVANCTDPANIIGTMQSFTAADCSTYLTPDANSYVAIGCLTDERDGKAYEVRKFADGNCWMVDNLAYGGDVEGTSSADVCVTKTTFAGDINKSGSAWGYGDCRNSPNSPTYGYYYNWQATIQSALAFDGNDYQPPQPTQGICPAGWHLPSGNTGGDLATLDQANDGTGVVRSNGCATTSCNFFRPGYNFKGVYSGFTDANGVLNQRGSRSYWWTSTPHNSDFSYYLGSSSDHLNPGTVNAARSNGFTVRCLRDLCELGSYEDGGTCADCATAIPGCTTCANGSVCSVCEPEYVLENGACLITPEAPTNLTLPAEIYNAATITISWDPAPNATSYVLERSCNSGAWSQIYLGAATSTTNSVADCEGPVRYRVKAYNTVITIASGYTASASRSYSSCSANCTACSGGATCTTCATGYYLAGDTCVAFTPTADCSTAIGTMQTFTAADCATYAKPAALGYTAIGCLVDERDGKAYEVRKFADGKCWMVDNLKYGGASDACANKTTFAGYGSATPTNRFGTGTYGDCRNNPSNPAYGYLYNWQAAVQSASAYYGNSYQPPQPTQGICPTGWHLPSGNTGGEFSLLDQANGGTGAYRSCSDAPCTFFRPGGNFKGVYAGLSEYVGPLDDQGSVAYWWSSTRNDSYLSYGLLVYSSYLFPDDILSSEYGGFSVRCIKN